MYWYQSIILTNVLIPSLLRLFKIKAYFIMRPVTVVYVFVNS